MADESQLEILKSGMEAWNWWRYQNPNVEADLSEADLSEMDLRGFYLANTDLAQANLGGAHLEGANLTGADLTKADLRGANLRGADLTGAELTDANLQAANLRGAELRRASLMSANLTGANLRDANLTEAKVRDTTGFVEEQLTGTILTGADLPFDLLQRLPNIEEASKNAKRIFLWLQLACAYCWLTVYTTNDAGLLTNSATSTLPVIGSNVPIVGFYWAAPALLISLYVYFQLYLQRLWEALAVMPAVFQDGRTLDKAVYPWMITGLVHDHFPRLKDYRPPLYAVQRWAIRISAWWVAPLTILLIWGGSSTGRTPPARCGISGWHLWRLLQA